MNGTREMGETEENIDNVEFGIKDTIDCLKDALGRLEHLEALEALEFVRRDITRVRMDVGAANSAAWRTKTSLSKVRELTESKTVYAAVWDDHYIGDYGCYGTFSKKEAAVDYLVEVVRGRSFDLRVDVLDPSDWKTVMTMERIREELESDRPIMLVLSWSENHDGSREPDEYVSMAIMETEHFEGMQHETQE